MTGFYLPLSRVQQRMQWHLSIADAGLRAPVISLFTKLNPLDKNASISLSGADLVATSGANGDGIVRSIQAITGKRYFEAAFTDVTNGTATIAAGIATSAHALTASLGYSNAFGWAFWGTNTGARHNGVTAVALVGGNGAVLGFAVDQPAGKMWIRGSDGWIQGDPVTGASPIWSNLSGTLHAAACPWVSGSVVTMRFDPASFRDAAPSGFSPITA